MPSAFFIPSKMPPAKLLTLSASHPAAPLMPFQIPRTMSPPMLSTRSGSEVSPLTTALNMLLAPSAPLLAMFPAHEARLEITLPRKPAIFPGNCDTKLIALLRNFLPAVVALDAMFETHATTLEMTLPRKLATFAGRFEMKFTTLLTNCLPAVAALSAMLVAHATTLEMTPLSQSENICGSCEIVEPRFVKKSPIAWTALPMKSLIPFHALVTASRKPSFVFQSTTIAAISPATSPTTRPIGDASCAALRSRCAIVIPSVAVFQLLNAVTSASTFCATMIVPNAAEIPARSGAIVGRLSLSHDTPFLIGGMTLETPSLIELMKPVTFSLPMES